MLITNSSKKGKNENFEILTVLSIPPRVLGNFLFLLFAKTADLYFGFILQLDNSESEDEDSDFEL